MYGNNEPGKDLRARHSNAESRQDLVFTNVQDVKPGMKNLNLKVILIDKKEKRTSHGTLVLLLIGDETACVIMTSYDYAFAARLNSGDCLLILGCEGRLWKQYLQISLEKIGKIKRFGEDCQLYNPTKNITHSWWQRESDGSDNLVCILVFFLTKKKNSYEIYPAYWWLFPTQEQADEPYKTYYANKPAKKYNYKQP